MSKLPVTILKSAAKTQGGLEKYTAKIIDAFLKKGHEVTLVTTKPPHIKRDHFHVYSQSCNLPFSFLKLRDFDAFCQKTVDRSSIVLGLDRTRWQTHLRAGNGVHAAYLAERKKYDPIWKRLSFDMNPLHKTILEIEKEAFENPSLKKLFTNSFMVKNEVLKHYNVDPDKVQVIHNGVQWLEMTPAFEEWPEKRKDLLSRSNLSSSDYQFLFVGHNYKRKGLDLLLEALAVLSDKNFHLTVIGKENNMSFYESFISKLGLHNKVSLLGPTDPIPYYQLADALVIPSQYDPFANVTVEALAMGLFVVSSKTNGGSEVLTHDTGSIIEDLSSKESIGFSLLKAMKSPKTKERSLMIRNSISKFDFSHQIGRLIEACLL